MGAQPGITALKAADQVLDRYEAELSRCRSENVLERGKPGDVLIPDLVALRAELRDDATEIGHAQVDGGCRAARSRMAVSFCSAARPASIAATSPSQPCSLASWRRSSRFAWISSGLGICSGSGCRTERRMQASLNQQSLLEVAG